MKRKQRPAAVESIRGLYRQRVCMKGVGTAPSPVQVCAHRAKRGDGAVPTPILRLHAYALACGGCRQFLLDIVRVSLYLMQYQRLPRF